MRIGIVGLGLMGGSLGKALKGLQRGIDVVGVTRTDEAAAAAVRAGAVDDASSQMAILERADVVVIATPIDEVSGVLDQTAHLVNAGTVLTDVASVKRPVRQWVRQLPEPGFFLGGHPVAGKAEQGLQASDASIFRDEPWIFTPLEAQSLRPFEGWIDLVRAIGARPRFLSPEEHDHQLAYLSHLAFTLSSAFAETVRDHADPSLGGPGYRGMARLAGGDAAMYESIARENRQPLLAAIDDLRTTMQRLRDRIAAGERLGSEVSSHASV